MTDLPDHDPDLGDHDRPISVITMDRSWRSRCAETRNQDKIVEFRVMIRPLQAVNAVHAQMRSMLEKLGGTGAPR
jgi:hypothetical protein